MSFENLSLLMIGRYERDEDGGGAWYLGDCDEGDTCVSRNLFVNAWMPLRGNGTAKCESCGFRFGVVADDDEN